MYWSYATLEVTKSQLQTIIEALEEYIDNEQSFLVNQIKDDPEDLETIIHTTVNIQNIKDMRPLIEEAKRRFK